MGEMRRSQLLPTAIPTEHLDATSPVKDPPIDVRIACNMSLQGSLKDTRIAESGARLEITCRLLIEGGHREILCGSSTCVVTQDGKFQSDCDLLPCPLPVASNATSFKALTPFSINRAREEHNYSKRPTESIKVVQARQQLLAKRLRNAKLSLLRRRRSVKKLKVNLATKLRSHNLFYDMKEKEFHGTLIIKKIVKTYIRTRLYHAGKDYRISLGISSRHGLSKFFLTEIDFDVFRGMPIPNWKMEIIEEIFGLFDPCLIDSIILSHRQEQIWLSFLPIDARFGLRGSFGRRGMAQRQLYLRVGKLKKFLLSYGITGKFFE
ncbi:hypothetical protein Fcan01_16279 [Folsomia candida]|uniref:Uncharacterized protein n=1 Tax=Folsomia candida TaxID=158441 RepID=A0A226DUT4_FOLCA|nr:hypothetical protein Fcan01_16279 [Folsomia candida]